MLGCEPAGVRVAYGDRPERIALAIDTSRIDAQADGVTSARRANPSRQPANARCMPISMRESPDSDRQRRDPRSCYLVTANASGAVLELLSLILRRRRDGCRRI